MHERASPLLVRAPRRIEIRLAGSQCLVSRIWAWLRRKHPMWSSVLVLVDVILPLLIEGVLALAAAAAAASAARR